MLSDRIQTQVDGFFDQAQETIALGAMGRVA